MSYLGCRQHYFHARYKKEMQLKCQASVWMGDLQESQKPPEPKTATEGHNPISSSQA